MVTILLDDIFKSNWIILIQIKMLLHIVPKGLIDNKPLLIQVMAWCRIGNNLLHESILTQFSDIYIYMWGF